MSRKLRETIVVAGVIYPAGTPESDIDGKVTAVVWEGDTDPADTTTGYAGQGADELKAEAEKRGLEVEGTGANGNVLKADLVAALEADDKANGNA